MKKIVALSVLLITSLYTLAQKPISEAAYTTAFKKIITDSYNDFKSIKGDKITTTKDSFNCKVVLPSSNGNIINTFALSSFQANYEIVEKKKAASLYRNIIAWTKKSYLPNKLGLKIDSSYNINTTRFFVLTSDGMENWRTSISLVPDVKKNIYKITIYVSGINKRVFTYANKSNVIKDEVLKNAINKLYTEAKNDNWEAITDAEEIVATDLPFDPPFGFDDGKVNLSKFQLPYGKSYIYTDGSDKVFVHCIPLNSKQAESKKLQTQWISKLNYALPSYYVYEKRLKKEDFLFMTYYPTEKYETTLYEGIELELGTAEANDEEIGQYLIIQFKLYNSFSIK